MAAKGDKIDPTTPVTSNAIRQSLNAVMMANGSISVFAVAKLVLLLGAVMSVIYLVSQREADNPGEYLTLTAIVSFFSFFVWAYAVDAVAFRPIHDGVLASILLASFTLVSGAITPAAQDAMVKMIKFKKAAGNDEQ